MFSSIQEIQTNNVSSQEHDREARREAYKHNIMRVIHRVINDAVLLKEAYCVIPMAQGLGVFYPDVWKDVIAEINKTTDYFCAASGFAHGVDICYGGYTEPTNVVVILIRQNHGFDARVVFPMWWLLLTVVAWSAFAALLYFGSLANLFSAPKEIMLFFLLMLAGIIAPPCYLVRQYFWEYVPIKKALAAQQVQSKTN